MIQEFHINDWLEDKNAKIITWDNRPVKILNYDETKRLVTAEVDGVIRNYSPNGHCLDEDKPKLNLWIEDFKELTDLENAIYKLLLPPCPITRIEAFQRACKESPKILEIAKKELEKGN